MKNILILLLLVSANISFAGEMPPDLEIQQLKRGVYLHTSFKVIEGFGLVGSNGLVVVDRNNAYIIDTPWSEGDTEKLVSWIEERGLSIKGSISTHSHEDRTAGVELLNSKSIPTYASKLTNELLEKGGRTQARNSFEGDSFWLLEDQIEIFYPGGGHTRDNVVVWLPEPRILFGGCLIRAQESKNLGYVGEAVIGEWPDSIRRLESKYKNIKLVVPGHGSVGGVSLLEHTRKLADAASNKSVQPTANASAD